MGDHLLRSRWTVVLFAVLATLLVVAAPAQAAPGFVVAQAGEGDEESGTEEGSETEGETGGGEGQSDPEAETETGEEGSEPAATETGPPWTYQMARIGLVLLVFLGLAIGAAYYRFVASRQRGAA